MANEARPGSNGGAVDAGIGYFIVGEFLSAYPGDAYTDSRGVEKTPLNVKLLVQDEAVTVRFNDLNRSEALVAGKQRGERLQLRVFPRLVKPKDGAAFLKIEGYVARA